MPDPGTNNSVPHPTWQENHRSARQAEQDQDLRPSAVRESDMDWASVDIDKEESRKIIRLRKGAAIAQIASAVFRFLTDLARACKDWWDAA
jgi:hypothetical protein